MRKEDVLEIERQKKLHEMKVAVHSKCSSIAPNIFLKKWERQSFYDLSERALQKKDLEMLPIEIFLFLYKNFSPISGFDVFHILTVYSLDNLTLLKSHFNEIEQVVAESELSEADFEHIIEFMMYMMYHPQSIEFGTNIMSILSNKKWPKSVVNYLKGFAIENYLQHFKYGDAQGVGCSRTSILHFQRFFKLLESCGILSKNLLRAYSKVIDLFEYEVKIALELEEAICSIQHGTLWKDGVTESKGAINVYFSFPNGKDGDIDMCLASQLGTPSKLNGLLYSIEISTEDRTAVELIIGSLQNPLMKQNQEAVRYLVDTNYYFGLCALVADLHDNHFKQFPACCALRDNFFLPAQKCIDQYYKELVNVRNRVYEEVVTDGKASAPWKSEQRLYALAKELYPDAVYQFRAEWLGLQSLDVYIPSINTAIEYQGIQHYQPVDLFGGEEGYEQRKTLDAKKKRLCNKAGIQLIYWKYDVPISSDLLKSKLLRPKKAVSMK